VPNLDGGGGGRGGGIYNSGTLTVTNSTFSGNSAVTSGGGIYNTGTLNYSNTIIANSTGGDCTLNAGSIGTNTTNLVEDGSCSASLSGDPSLGALADYGGPTQTMALQSGSLAIDAGDDATCAAAPVNNLDQRGVTRPLDGNGDGTATCDVGAYESGAATTTPTPTNTPSGPTPTPTHTPTSTPTHTPAPPTATHTATNTPGGFSSTGFLAPSIDGAETTKAGDNNGYEVSPGNAYAADGLVAADANSGSSADTNCTSQQKDKHRYYNYNFNIPAQSVVSGIEVRLTGSAATTSGAPKICIQVSWNRGDSWTAAQSVPLTTVNTTYVLGSPTDTWGRTWALGDFSNTNFRVRVIDVASSTTNTFSLDAIAVNITYQP
jgi:predicted outer membrane repeat protein